MSRPGHLLSSALLRPIHLAALGAGLLLALTWAPWWIFPLSGVAYTLMVFAALRDPAFVRAALRGQDDERAGTPLDWSALSREIGAGPWAAPLLRISVAERNLGTELSLAPEGARPAIAATLAQFRSAARLGVDLARRLRSLDRALRSYAGMDPAASRYEAQNKRTRAAAAADETAKNALLQAADALEESAATADALRTLHGRTAAQIESLAAMLESVAVRGVRLRLADTDAGELTATLGAEIEAVRETLSVLESMEPVEPAVTGANGTRGER